MSRSLFLIDGNSLLNRAYYALPPLTTINGEPTNAVYGFSMMLFRLLDDYQPDKIMVAFDVGKPTFRHQAYEEYKAHRTGMPDDLRPQVGILKEVLDAWGIERLELAGYEADDIIGTVAKKGESLGYQVYIVTGDRDAFQLISEQTKILLTKRGIKEVEVIDLKALYDLYELEPKQIIDLKGLMGDTSDNIPGVPGVGEKTALKLLKKHNSIEQLYQQIDQEKGKLKERLIENHDQALLSKELATIDCNVPIEVDFDAALEYKQEELVKLFQRLEFKSLLERITGDQLELQLVGEEHTSIPLTQVTSADQFAEFKEAFLASNALGLEVTEELITIGGQQQTWVFPCEYHLELSQFLADHSGKVKLYCNDYKLMLRLFYETLQDWTVDLDIGLAAYVLNPGGNSDLSSLSVHYGGLSPLVELDDPLQASAQRCWRMVELAPFLKEQMKVDDLWHLYTELEFPLAKILAHMEHTGILVNQERLADLSSEMEESLTRLTEEIYEIAGEEFNINSPKQLGVILFEKLGLPVIKRTKTGPSTDAEVLDQLSYHPVVNKILEYRQINKLKSTYADALAELINPNTKRIHTTYNQTVTATGRLSSTNPNLQNIPVRTKEGKRIRGTFEAAPGCQLLTADYSQIELRVLAHFSQDEGLISAFNSGRDIHTQTAAEVLGIPLDQVTPEERNQAKAINFGIVYGISSFGLARGTNLSQAKAQEYIDLYFRRYPGVKAYMDNIIKQAKELGYVTTLLKRRRYLPDINSKNYMRRNFAQRMAMNTPIQGSAADIIKLAMLKVEKSLRDNNLQARLLLQVHDELVLEVPNEELEQVAKIVKADMEGIIDLLVKLEVDINVGENWEAVKPL